jgi:hypothetical protein
MSSKNPQLEEIRLATATELMYGNKDKNSIFAFDVRNRFEYLIYSEKLRLAEDGVTVYSDASSKKYQFFAPHNFQTLIEGQGKRKNYFERKGLKWTVLHDPYLQAEKEGVTIKGALAKKTGLSLAEKLAKAKPASEVGNGSPLESTSAEETQVSEQQTVPRKGQFRKKEVEA